MFGSQDISCIGNACGQRGGGGGGGGRKREREEKETTTTHRSRSVQTTKIESIGSTDRLTFETSTRDVESRLYVLQVRELYKPYPLTDTRNTGTKYELFAVCNHRGAIGGGHYYTYAKSPMDGKWRVYNDTKVYDIDSKKRIVTKNAYLLFYQRKDVIGKSLSELYPNAPQEISRLSKSRDVEAFKAATWDKPKETEASQSSFFGRSHWSPFSLDDSSSCVLS